MRRGDVYMQDGDRWGGLASEFSVRMMDRKGRWMKSERGGVVVETQLRKLGLEGWSKWDGIWSGRGG